MAQTVKRLSTMWETWVWSLGLEDPLEKKMATHSSTIAWKITWTEKPGRLQSMGSQRVGHDRATSLTQRPLLYISVNFTNSFIMIFSFGDRNLIIEQSQDYLLIKLTKIWVKKKKSKNFWAKKKKKKEKRFFIMF